MRESEFWTLMADEFGETYADMVARTQHLSALGGRSAAQALDAGLAPRRIWEALCDQMGVPEERRLGRDRPLRRSAAED